MDKGIFKVGDRVFHIEYGWGIINEEGNAVIKVVFLYDTITFIDGNLLSFTEYTLQGFSQERPIVLPKVGELCLVRDADDTEWAVRRFKEYRNGIFRSQEGLSWKIFKRIKILD